MPTYTYSRDPLKGESLVVSGEVTRVLTTSNPRFNDVKSYIFNAEDNGQEWDFGHVLSLIDSGPEAVNKIAQLSERVSYDNGRLLFDGDEVETALAEHIVRMVKAGDESWPAYVQFLENLANNPSKKSRKALFEWVKDRGLILTEDGEFIAYKGVNSNENRTSIHSGGAYVDGQWVSGHIPNRVGSVITMPRSGVDPDRDSACSTGLHAGTSKYARSFGPKIILVAINPRDVVMVPKDCDSQKLRVCRYTVVEDDNTEDLTTTTYGGQHRYEAPQEDHHERCADCQDSTPVNELQDGLCRDCHYYSSEYCDECGYGYDVCECDD